MDSTKEFSSSSGMATKQWGPALWKSLFIMILGSYPVTLDIENKEHLAIKKYFISTFNGLKYTLPCSFCRASIATFMKELPIEKYTDSRINMAHWLYLIKDKVNKKLINQELEYFTHLYKKYKTKKIDKLQYINATKLCFTTVPSPPFIDVLRHYEKYRAVCSKKLKRCVSKQDK